MAHKRGQNEGSIFQRKDGRWCGVLSLGVRDGRRARKSFYGATAADIQDQITKAKSDRNLGLPVSVERQTVKEFLDRWLEESVKPSVRALTHQQYSQHVRLYLGPVLGRLRLAKLSPQHVQAFVNEKLKSGLSPRTVQLSLVILRHALDTAVKWNLACRNVAKLVDSPKVRRPEIRPLDPEQARRRAARGPKARGWRRSNSRRKQRSFLTHQRSQDRSAWTRRARSDARRRAVGPKSSRCRDTSNSFAASSELCASTRRPTVTFGIQLQCRRVGGVYRAVRHRGRNRCRHGHLSP